VEAGITQGTTSQVLDCIAMPQTHPPDIIRYEGGGFAHQLVYVSGGCQRQDPALADGLQGVPPTQRTNIPDTCRIFPKIRGPGRKNSHLRYLYWKRKQNQSQKVEIGGAHGFPNTPRKKSWQLGQRNSSFELLRILCILLIILHHYSAHGVQGLTEHALTINKIIEQVLSMGGKIGVNCFVLITGYFMTNAAFKYKKLLKLILEVFFYSVLSLIVFFGLGLAAYDSKVVKESLFPLTYDMYWFATAYIVMYLLSPFINSFIKILSQERHLKFILLLVVLWSVVPTFTFGQAAGYSSLGWFILLYLIAAYIKLYPHKYFIKCKVNIIVAFLLYMTMVLSVILLDTLGIQNSTFADTATYLREMNMLPTLLCSISLFLGFKNLNVGSNKVINTISASAFGVYLIHDNYFVGPYLWGNVFKNTLYLDSTFLLPHAIITTLLIFCGCTIIDQIRLHLFEKPVFWLIDRKQESILTYADKLKDSLKKVVFRQEL